MHFTYRDVCICMLQDLVNDIGNGMASNLYISQEAFVAVHFAPELFLVHWFKMLYVSFLVLC